MGLDITAYEHATLLDDHTPPADDWCPHEDGDEHRQAYVLVPFEPSAAGLELLEAQRGVRFGRCYRLYGETQGFRAGSYGGYNMWRQDLIDFALTILPPGTDQAPFRLLTYFADNEGWIGPDAATTLAEEFERHEDAAQKLDLDGYWIDKYQDWAIAFRLAAGTGVVRFH